MVNAKQGLKMNGKSTIAEIRLQNLMFLIEQYKSIANLNVAIGRKRTDATLSQIKNRVRINKQKGRRSMGYELARTIEKKLNLENGWMDEFHERIQPEEENEEPISLSDLQSLASIPLFFQSVSGSAGASNPKGEIQLPNHFVDSLVNHPNSNLAGYIANESAMYKTMPQGSIVLVDQDVNKYVGDGVYFLLINQFHKFRKISQLLSGEFVIESDINKETIKDIREIVIQGKVTNIWINQKA